MSSCNSVIITPEAPNLVTVDCDEIAVMYVEPSEVVVVTVAEQGPVGPTGPGGPPGPPGGAAAQRIEAVAVGGVETVSLPLVPSSLNAVQLFVNGLLHRDTADYTIAGTILSLQASAGTVAGDSITVLFY